VKQTALVTGASGGIGLELARLFASDRYDLVLVARSQGKLHEIREQLEAAHGITATVIAADLSEPNTARDLVDALRAGSIEVDVLVNNAGIGLSGPFLDNDPHAQHDLLQLNVVALTELTRLLLPAMVARRSGRILNVASSAAFVPDPLAAVYGATKAYVLSFSEAIGEELRRSGVTVTALCPGATLTGFSTVAGAGSTRLYSKLKPMSSADVARAGYQGLRDGRRVVVTGLRNKLLVQSARVSPRRVVTKVARRLWETA
jgi:short-subunit dehydrogenase